MTRSGTPQGPGPSVPMTPEGDERERLVCPDCGYVQYENPKIIVGAVCVWENRLLLCRRAIAPREGFWTLPAGYMELHETTEQGAAREVWEEAGARVRIDSLLAVYNLPAISQVHLIYRARLLAPEVGPSPESLESRLFAWEDIPWDELAFPTVTWALRQFHAPAPVGALVQTNPADDAHCRLPEPT